MFNTVVRPDPIDASLFFPALSETLSPDAFSDRNTLYRKLKSDLKDHLAEVQLADGGLDIDSLLAIGAWLETCSPLDPRRRILELTLFAGFSAEEAAEALGLSVGSVRHELCLVRLYAARCREGLTF